jgi:ribulose-5-phosphate 4-epimerase/fuculose-1-phosphate aldolase
MPDEIEKLKQELVVAHKILYMEGVREHIMGHVSVRVPGTNNFLVPGHVHEIGGGIEDVTSDYINMYDLDGDKKSGTLPDLDELVIHTAILRARKDVNSVVHAHGPMTTALSIAGKLIQPINAPSIYWGIATRDTIAMLDDDWPFISTPEQGKQLVRALGKRRAVVHRGHAMVTVGSSIGESCTRAIMIEHAARMQILASIVGKPKVFSQKTIKRWNATMSEMQTKNDLWEYLKNKLEKWSKGQQVYGGGIPPL